MIDMTTPEANTGEELGAFVRTFKPNRGCFLTLLAAGLLLAG